MRISDCSDLSQALVGTGFAYDRRDRPDFYLRPFKAVMERCQGLRRGGAAALELALLADGRLDAFWEFNLKRWDVAAGVLLIREAGGVVTTIEGGPLEGLVLDTLAGNPALHEQLGTVLAEAM